MWSEPTTTYTNSCLAVNADVNAKDKFQGSPLHYACSYKNPDVAELLVNNGANIDSADESNQTPLMFSIFYVTGQT